MELICIIIIVLLILLVVTLCNAPDAPAPVPMVPNYTATIVSKSDDFFTNAVCTDTKKIYVSGAQYDILKVGKTYTVVLNRTDQNEAELENIVALVPTTPVVPNK